mgnify:FL=1
MKSTIEHSVNTERQYATMVIATTVVRRKRHQMCVCMFERLGYAEAVAIAKPSIEAWETNLEATVAAAAEAG